MTVFNDTYDTVTPAGSDDPTEGDDRIREVKAAIQERENVDHYWPLTGTEVSDADTGEHRKVTLRTGSAPSAVADKGFVYAKDVAAKAELFYIDEDGNEVQLTSGGEINADLSTLPDGCVLAAATESGDPDRTVSDKAWADQAAAAAMTPSSYAGEESVTLPNGMIMKMGHVVTTTPSNAVSFDTPFPTGVVSVMVVMNRTNNGFYNNVNITTNSFDVNGFTARAVDNTDLEGFYWMAIGY